MGGVKPFSSLNLRPQGCSRSSSTRSSSCVARTKQEVQGDLGVCGPTLAASFLQRGLIDEYRLFVRPIVLGGGKPYFTALDRPIALRLAETRAFPDGVVLLRYERARGDRIPPVGAPAAERPIVSVATCARADRGAAARSGTSLPRLSRERALSPGHPADRLRHVRASLRA